MSEGTSEERRGEFAGRRRTGEEETRRNELVGSSRSSRSHLSKDIGWESTLLVDKEKSRSVDERKRGRKERRGKKEQDDVKTKTNLNRHLLSLRRRSTWTHRRSTHRSDEFVSKSGVAEEEKRVSVRRDGRTREKKDEETNGL